MSKELTPVEKRWIRHQEFVQFLQRDPGFIEMNIDAETFATGLLEEIRK